MITIIQGIIFITYISFLLIKFGKPLPSISDSWYQLEGLQKSFFTWFCWSLGFFMLFQTNGTSPLFFLSGAGLCFVGAATMFKSDDKFTPIIHFLGALICILSALIGIWIERNNYLPLILYGITSLILSSEKIKLKNKIWWIEIIAFIYIIIGLLFISK